MDEIQCRNISACVSGVTHCSIAREFWSFYFLDFLIKSKFPEGDSQTVHSIDRNKSMFARRFRPWERKKEEKQRKTQKSWKKNRKKNWNKYRKIKKKLKKKKIWKKSEKTEKQREKQKQNTGAAQTLFRPMVHRGRRRSNYGGVSPFNDSATCIAPQLPRTADSIVKFTNYLSPGSCWTPYKPQKALHCVRVLRAIFLRFGSFYAFFTSQICVKLDFGW